MSALHLEENQDVLRYEAYRATKDERLKAKQQQQQQQPSSAANERSPFASGRPQHDDRYGLLCLSQIDQTVRIQGQFPPMCSAT